MHISRGKADQSQGRHRASGWFLFNVWDPGEHPKKRQQLEGGAAGRHERCPELDAGGRRAGRQHCRPKVSCYQGEAVPQTGLHFSKHGGVVVISGNQDGTG